MVSYIPLPDEDRRKIMTPVEIERRLDERLSILEVKLEHQTERIEDNKLVITKLFERFDDHVADEIEQVQQMQKAMIEMTSTVTELTTEMSRTNRNVESLAKTMAPVVAKVNKWSTAWVVAKSAVSIAVLVVAAFWTVFAFVVDHSDNISLLAPKMEKKQ